MFSPMWITATKQHDRTANIHVLKLVVALTIVVTAMSSCGTKPVQAPGKSWHHLSNGEFRNPIGTAPSTASISDMMSFFIRRMRDKPPQIPSDHVVPQAIALQDFAATNEENTVTWLGHSAFLLRLEGKNILTDPYLTEIAGPFGFGPSRYVAPGLSADSLPPIDIVLVSHNHYDHLDANTINTLPGKQRIHVVVPLGLGAFFRERGYTNVHEHDWFESVALDGIEIQVLPAIHFSRRGPFDRNRTLWASFAIRADDTSIYHSGDTGYGSVFKEIGDKAGPFDLALVAIGAYLPTSIMKTVHITPEEAVQLVSDIKADTAIGMHWGTVRLTDEDPFEPPVRFRAAGRSAGWKNERTRVMKIGQTLTLRALQAQ